MIIDFSASQSRIPNGSFYTAMSRVRCGKNLYLREFRQDLIKANASVEKKLETMKLSVPYSFNKINVEKQIFEVSERETKIGYININSLYDGRSIEFLNGDENLLNLDFLLVADTRLTEKESTERLEKDLDNWTLIHRYDSNDNVKHMGLILLQSKKSNSKHQDISRHRWMRVVSDRNMTFAQILKLKFEKPELEVSFVYIRMTPTTKDSDLFKEYMRNSNVILGDLNLDPNKEADNRKLSHFLESDKKRALFEVTTNHGNQLDHILIDTNINDYFTTAYNNHTSDHKAIVIRLPHEGNSIGNSFKQDYFKRNNHWIRKPTIKSTNLRDDDEDERFKRDYIEVLNADNNNKHIFSFHLEDMTTSLFENLPVPLKDIKILTKFDEVFFAVSSRDNYNIIHWNSEKLTLYERKCKDAIKTYQKGLKQLTDFKEFYLDKLLESFKKKPVQLKFSVEAVIEGRSTDHVMNVLKFLKLKFLNKNYDETQTDTGKIREDMDIEIQSGKLIKPVKPVLKRKGVQTRRESKKARIAFRTIRNPDNESCWLNSCTQITLAAMEYSNNLDESQSTLMNQLKLCLQQDHSSVIDPIPIRNILIEAERTRIVIDNVIPENRLFHFYRTNTRNYDQLCKLSERNRIGQQDCKDYFVCLKENKEHWIDVFNMFRFKTQTFSQCSLCGYVSRNPATYEHSFIMIDPPTDETSLSEMIDRKLNNPELRTGWRDENGCGQTTDCYNFTRFDHQTEFEFLTVIVNRLYVNLHGNLEINRNKIRPDAEIQITTADESKLSYKLIGIIHHDGHVIGNDTMGHYMADILEKETNRWIETSDDRPPRELELPTDEGYIFLFKRA